MKRLITHLAVGIAAFFTGITIELIFTPNNQSKYAPKLEAISPPLPSVGKLPAQSSAALPELNLILDYDPKEFNPRGDYFILGHRPKELREFYCLELAVDEINGRASGNAMIEIYADQMYNSYFKVSGLITKEHITFVATPIFEEDFEYRFDGYFLRAGVLSDASKNRAVLKGKLSKLKGGVKVSESKVSFRVEYLGC